jgi:hypothetical protein
VITGMIDPRSGTMSTLYGNDAAVNYARTHAGRDYPAGAVLSLVTWRQGDDPRWFGAKIPERAQMVEFVRVGEAKNGAPQSEYEVYTGNPLVKAPGQYAATEKERVEYIVSARAVVMP